MVDSYDSFEQARVLIERLYELLNEASTVGIDTERGREIEAEARSLFADDLEHVTRYGVVRGPEHALSEVRVQLQRFEIEMEIIDVREASNSVVVLARSRRVMRDSPSDYLEVYPGSIFRVRDGRIVFWEGFPAGRDALKAAGIEH